MFSVPYFGIIVVLLVYIYVAITTHDINLIFYYNAVGNIVSIFNQMVMLQKESENVDL